MSEKDLNIVIARVLDVLINGPMNEREPGAIPHFYCLLLLGDKVQPAGENAVGEKLIAADVRVISNCPDHQMLTDMFAQLHERMKTKAPPGAPPGVKLS